MRTYWDSGTVPEEVVKLARTIRPVKPFGLAFYYSVPVERAYEKDYPTTGQLYPMTGGYSANTGGGKAHEAQHAGVPVGYSVSDEALDRLEKESRPTGWLTCGVEKMPKAELAKLKRVAPVYDLNKVKDFGRSRLRSASRRGRAATLSRTRSAARSSSSGVRGAARPAKMNEPLEARR
jgi:hypothetical protein